MPSPGCLAELAVESNEFARADGRGGALLAPAINDAPGEPVEARPSAVGLVAACLSLRDEVPEAGRPTSRAFAYFSAPSVIILAHRRRTVVVNDGDGFRG